MAIWVVQLGGALDRIDDMMHEITEDAQTVQEEAQKIMETACETQELRDQRFHHYEMKVARLLDVLRTWARELATHVR